MTKEFDIFVRQLKKEKNVNLHERSLSKKLYSFSLKTLLNLTLDNSHGEKQAKS